MPDVVDSEARTAVVVDCGCDKMAGKLSGSGNASVERYLNVFDD